LLLVEKCPTSRVCALPDRRWNDGHVDDAEQARIEKDLRMRLAKPKYPAIFYLSQAYEVHSPEPVPAAPMGTTRCTSVARSERDLGGNRAGWAGVVREPVSCALEAGHSGPHKTASFPISMSKVQSHWEWSDPPVVGPGYDGVPEDAIEMGPAAIASFSGRLFDGNNQGLPWTDASSRPPFAELWRHAGFRFRAGIMGSAAGLVAGMVFLGLFLNDPRWQSIVVCGVAYVIGVYALVQANQAVMNYQGRPKSQAGQTPVSKSPPGN
jgi:hypothetical protein